MKSMLKRVLDVLSVLLVVFFFLTKLPDQETTTAPVATVKPTTSITTPPPVKPTEPINGLDLSGLIRTPAPETKVTGAATSFSVNGWTTVKPSNLDKKEVLLTVNHNGTEKFFVYHKHEKRDVPVIELSVGSSVTIKVTIPNLTGVGDLTRSAYDSGSSGKSTIKQMTYPLVGRGKRLPLSPSGWNGKTVDWQITGVKPTKGNVLATLTLMCDVAPGNGPEGGKEAKYMPKVRVRVLPSQSAKSKGGFQKLGNAYLFLPDTPTNEIVVWLGGSGENGSATLEHGLPKQVAQFGSNQIVLVPSKQTQLWDAGMVAQTINDALSFVTNQGYEIKHLYGEGFSAGGQGIAEVVASQQVNMQFTSIKLFGSNTNGKTTRLLDLLNGNHLAGVTFYVGEGDNKFASRVMADHKTLVASGKSQLYVVPDVGHRIDPLYAYAQNTP